jgi:hypothetical protein
VRDAGAQARADAVEVEDEEEAKSGAQTSLHNARMPTPCN